MVHNIVVPDYNWLLVPYDPSIILCYNHDNYKLPFQNERHIISVPMYFVLYVSSAQCLFAILYSTIILLAINSKRVSLVLIFLSCSAYTFRARVKANDYTFLITY